jgi:hypothetical protein
MYSCKDSHHVKLQLEAPPLFTIPVCTDKCLEGGQRGVKRRTRKLASVLSCMTSCFEFLTVGYGHSAVQSWHLNSPWNVLYTVRLIAPNWVKFAKGIKFTGTRTLVCYDWIVAEYDIPCSSARVRSFTAVAHAHCVSCFCVSRQKEWTLL